MKKTSTIAAALLMAFAAAAIAAQPTSFSFGGNGKTNNGVEFAKYTVKCSNGKTYPLTAWDHRRQWCVGEQSRENCHSRQMQAANAACRIN